jgi:hypothetical protein
LVAVELLEQVETLLAHLAEQDQVRFSIPLLQLVVAGVAEIYNQAQQLVVLVAVVVLKEILLVLTELQIKDTKAAIPAVEAAELAA